MSFKYLVFDFDGTLVDSMGMWGNVAPLYLKSKNIDLDPSKKKAFNNMSQLEAADWLKKNYNLSDSVEDIADCFLKIVDYEYRHTIESKKGVAEFLQDCQKNNIKMFILSLSDRAQIEACLKRLGLLGYFTSIYSLVDSVCGKNSPECFLNLLENVSQIEQNATLDDFVIIEDSYFASKSAKSAGFRVAGVFDKYQEEREKFKTLADHFFEDFPTYSKFIEYF